MTYHYGPNDEYLGHSSETPYFGSSTPAAILWLLICGVLYLCELFSGWQTMAQPYKYVAAYYYYMMVLPLKWIINVWDYGSSLTGYHNLNIIIGGIFVLSYVFAIIPLMMQICFEILKLFGIHHLRFVIIFLPGILCLMWLACSSIIGWLFAK